MANQQKLKLIEGVFSPQEAIKLISSLIQSKINFHKLDDFSNHIRYNKEIESSKNRIVELNQTLEEFKTMALEAKKLNKKLVLNSFINIDFED